MTIKYTYDEKENFLYTKCTGDLTDQDMKDFADQLAADPRIKRGMREIVDLRAVDSLKASTKSLGYMVHVNIDNREKYEGKRIAVVAPRELLYGISKYFEVISHIDNAPFRLEVFRTMAEAKEWLQLESYQHIK